MTVMDSRASLVGVFAVGIAIGLCSGCGGGGKAAFPDAAAVGTGGAGTTGPDGGTGGRLGTGGSDASVANPDGAVAPPSMVLIPGLAQLVDPGQACSSPVTPAGGTRPDQWCGAIRPGTVAGTVQLLAFNLTRAMAGTALTCTAGDTNCLVLSANLANTADAANGFSGETLIYYEANSIFAWRPGWTAGRAILQHDQLATCVGAPTAASAICIKATVDPNVYTLYDGRVDTQAGGLLTMTEPLSLDGSVTFSVDELSVLWSTRATAAAPETLKMQTIGDPTTRRTVATNVTQWNQTPDGSRWLWLSQPVTDATMVTTGTLQTAPFPSGAAPATVHAAVLQYAAWSANGVMVLATPGTLGADLKAIANIDTPTIATVIGTQNTIGFTDLTSDGTVLYVSDAVTEPTTMNTLINLLTSKADGTAKCTVNATPTADIGAYLTRSGLGVGWARSSATAFDGLFTTLSTCATATFSTVLSGYQDASGGVIVLENFNQTAFTAALSLAPYTAAGPLGTKIVIHPAANPIIMSLFPDLPRVVYSVNQTTTEGGIYVSGALAGTTQPFAGASSGASDSASAAALAAATAATRRARLSQSAARPSPRMPSLRVPSLGGGPRAIMNSPLLRLPRSPVAVVPTATRARPSRTRSTR